MGICRYWQQGTCTFGSSCRFEHVGRPPGNVFSANNSGNSQQNQDITNTLVTTVKQDVEASTKGKQWLFSCYSPAKDCASIPGLDDISPEEMRMESYTAKSGGTVTQYQQKYQQLIQTYTHKRQALANPTNELKEVFRKIYNKENLANIPANILEQQGTGGGNIFGNQQQQSSIFSGAGNTTASSATNTNLFGASKSTVFGGQSGNATPNSLFGQQQKPSFGGAPAFGQSPGNQSSGSIFGGQSASSGSIFGGGSNSNSVFGGQQQQQQQTSNTSMFGNTQSNPNQSPFGNSNQKSLFGNNTSANSSTPFGQQPQTTTPSSVFGQSGGASIFGQQSKQTTASAFGQTSTFGQPNVGSGGTFGQSQQSGSMFNQPTGLQSSSGSIFGQAQKTNTGVFGQPTTQTQTTSSSAFGQPTNTTSGSVFGQSNTGGLFGQQQQPTSAFGQSASNSPFGMSSATTTTASLSTPLISSTTTTPATSSNPFQKSNDPFAQKSSSGVGGGLFGKKVEDQLDDSIYSLIEALSAQELDAFKAPSFTLGLIPEKPPPKELCV